MTGFYAADPYVDIEPGYLVSDFGRVEAKFEGATIYYYPRHRLGTGFGWIIPSWQDLFWRVSF